MNKYNKYRKTFSQKKRRNTMRKTLKKKHISKNKYRKLFKKKNMTLRKNLALNNILKKRYQIGCSKKNNNMNGGGILPFQALNDLANNTQHILGSTLATTLGTTPELSPNPTTTSYS